MGVHVCLVSICERVWLYVWTCGCDCVVKSGVCVGVIVWVRRIVWGGVALIVCSCLVHVVGVWV